MQVGILVLPWADIDNYDYRVIWYVWCWAVSVELCHENDGSFELSYK